MKYRIIKVVEKENKSWGLRERIIYIPQYKYFLFWSSFQEANVNLWTKHRIHNVFVEFNSLEEAKSFLKRQADVCYIETQIYVKIKIGK